MLDQFYTNEIIAIECIKKLQDKVDIEKYDIHMEPSAGTGSFYKLMDSSKRIGIDIDSKCEGVINMDFLNYQPNVDNKYLVLGNPPFGKNCSMAIKFFNKAAEFSDCIAFIVPRTFKRVSIQNLFL